MRVRPAFASNDGDVVTAWALAGLGIVERSEWAVANELRGGRLAVVLPGWRLADAGVVALPGPREGRGPDRPFRRYSAGGADAGSLAISRQPLNRTEAIPRAEPAKPLSLHRPGKQTASSSAFTRMLHAQNPGTVRRASMHDFSLAHVESGCTRSS